MRFLRGSSGLVVVLALLVGLMAVPASAQETLDGDGYPLEVGGELIVDDDVTVVESDARARVVVPAADTTEVMGRTLALTGTQLIALVLAGLLLLALGGVGLVVTRRRGVVQRT